MNPTPQQPDAADQLLFGIFQQLQALNQQFASYLNPPAQVGTLKQVKQFSDWLTVEALRISEYSPEARAFIFETLLDLAAKFEQTDATGTR